MKNTENDRLCFLYTHIKYPLNPKKKIEKIMDKNSQKTHCTRKNTSNLSIFNFLNARTKNKMAESVLFYTNVVDEAKKYKKSLKSCC